MNKLMVDVLGYDKYGARGSDLGGTKSTSSAAIMRSTWSALI